MTTREYKKHIKTIKNFSILNYSNIDNIINKIKNDIKVKNKGDSV